MTDTKALDEEQMEALQEGIEKERKEQIKAEREATKYGSGIPEGHRENDDE